MEIIENQNQTQSRDSYRAVSRAGVARRTALGSPGGMTGVSRNAAFTRRSGEADRTVRYNAAYNAAMTNAQVRRRARRNRAFQRLWRGLLSFTASAAALLLSAAFIVNGFRADLDRALGTSSFRVVTDTDGSGEAYSYPSDYANTGELVRAVADISEQISAEGIVLLKNNGALPLSSNEKSKISLMGFSSYHPVTGGIPGTGITPNYGADADTVDFTAALKQRGFEYNPALETLYANLFDFYSTEISSPDGSVTITSPAITAPGNFPGSAFSNREPSPYILDQAMPRWRESLELYNIYIITLARGGSENGNYTPGPDGVNLSQNLNQSDPLGLSDAERDLIRAAADARDITGGKLIILLNTSNPMEIQELADNTAIDAILQIGFPGGYGFYALCDILDGTVNPSGRLCDTWAVKNFLSPAAQNYGFLPWDHIDPDNHINSAIIQAEGIYTGYKYYETRYFDSVIQSGGADSPVGSSTGGPWIYSQEITYPFGYGLSYTDFIQSLDDLEINLSSGMIHASVTVSNTGSVPGRDAVQLYASVPYTDRNREHGVEKSAVQLIDYAKTNILSPGQSETIEFHADLKYLSSWDSNADNAVNTQGCYILDPGIYYFTVGDGAHDAVNHVLSAMGYDFNNGMTNPGYNNYNNNYYYNPAQIRTWTLNPDDISANRTAFSYLAYTKNHTAVKNQLNDLDFNFWIPGTIQYLSRADWENTFPRTYIYLGVSPRMAEIMRNDLYTPKSTGSDISFGVNHGLKLADLKNISDPRDPRWAFLTEQITLEESLLQSGFGGAPQIMASISAPAVSFSDGPNGIASQPLGYAANNNNNNNNISDPCAVQPDDPNGSYQAGVLPCACVIAQTFNQILAEKIGRVMGNYSLWSNIPIWRGVMTNLHRTPYNANHYNSYSEDPVLSALQASATVRGARTYGLIAAPGNLFFQDSQADRLGAAVFMTEQKARECELRSARACFEDADALGAVTSSCRAGVYTVNAHPNLIRNILRGEWGFRGLIAESDMIPDPTYATLKEAVLNGVTMTGISGENEIDAVSAYYDYWTVNEIQKDPDLTAALKQAMFWRSYALANSNAMDGEISHTRLSIAPAWYDYILWGFIILFAFLTLFHIIQYANAARKPIDAPVRRRIPAAGLRDIMITALFAGSAIAACLIRLQINANIYYNINYFNPDLIPVIPLAAAAVLCVVRVPANWNSRPGLGDLIPVLISISLSVSLSMLTRTHIQTLAAFFRFTDNPSIFARPDVIALAALGFCAAAALFAIISGFRDVTRDI